LDVESVEFDPLACDHVEVGGCDLTAMIADFVPTQVVGNDQQNVGRAFCESFREDFARVRSHVSRDKRQSKADRDR
jgi:hypothetical protein